MAWFSPFITFCIIGNTVVLSMDRYPISNQETTILENLNTFFSTVFFFEMLLKMLGMGLKHYF